MPRPSYPSSNPFADVLKELLTSSRPDHTVWTPVRLAQEAGFHPTLVPKWLWGARVPTNPDVVERIARALNLSPAEKHRFHEAQVAALRLRANADLRQRTPAQLTD